MALYTVLPSIPLLLQRNVMTKRNDISYLVDIMRLDRQSMVNHTYFVQYICNYIFLLHWLGLFTIEKIIQ